MSLSMSTSVRRLVTARTALAALVASAVNLAIWLGAAAVGVTLTVPGPGGAVMTLSPAPIVLASVAGVLGAALVLAVLDAVVRRPRRTFEVIALTVLLLSLVPVLAMDVPMATRAALLSMHVLTAVVTVLLLRHAARPER